MSASLTITLVGTPNEISLNTDDDTAAGIVASLTAGGILTLALNDGTTAYVPTTAVASIISASS